MEFTKIAVATGNKGKLREIREIFQGVELVSMEELGFQGEIEETGDSFRKNAKIKAEFIARKYNMPTIRDCALTGSAARRAYIPPDILVAARKQTASCF